jgi:hypothetical protein
MIRKHIFFHNTDTKIDNFSKERSYMIHNWTRHTLLKFYLYNSCQFLIFQYIMTTFEFVCTLARASMILQNPEANDKNNYRHHPSKVSTKSYIYIHTTIIHQKSIPKAKHIYNHYPSYIVHPPYIKSKFQKA